MKRLLICIMFLVSVTGSGFNQALSPGIDQPEQSFKSPPVKYQPYVWWHWMGNNITAGGITADLEAMKASGIAGATIFNISSNADKGGFVNNSYTEGITYHNPAWWSMVRHAATEAGRLGLEIGMHNCAGYMGSGGTWITPEMSMQRIVWTSVSGPMPYHAVMPQPATTLGYYRDIAVLAVPGGEPSPDQVLDITSLMAPDGSLNWDVPQGSWTVYRFGHTSTGMRMRPVPEDLNGRILDGDKMSTEVMTFHMHQILDPLRENLGPLVGRSFKHILFDSFESGDQDWTPKMREEFLKRRGYDLIPWLPVLAGRSIGGKERASRFEWDLKTTVSELIIENAYLLPKKMINEMGMEMQAEPYGGPFDEVHAAMACDQPMVEFWINPRTSYGGEGFTASAIRCAGIKILAAEAFTGDPSVSQFTETPASLKVAGDSAFTYGINRMILHHWTHQPFPDHIRPGMCFGWWGTHFGRNQTWYEPGKAWITYLARCQSLLQRGEQVVDFCVLEPDVPGSKGDALSTEIFLSSLSVNNGRLVFKNGRTYALLVLPERVTMLPAVARKLKQLVYEGAVVIGPRPEKSPGLQGCPDADREVSETGRELWSSIDGNNSGESRYGKGRVIWNQNPDSVLSEMGIAADLEIDGTANRITWVHRRDAGNDYYFIANHENKPAHFKVVVRTGGKIPELWCPETGKIEEAGIWQGNKSSTEVDIRLKNNGSVFLVFRRTARGKDPVCRITSSVPDSMVTVSGVPGKGSLLRSPVPGKFILEKASGRKQTLEIKGIHQPVNITGPWEVSFKPATGVPVSRTFDKLSSWTDSEDDEIKYFSGTATYRNEFTLSENILPAETAVVLDLGMVKDMAEVKINGKTAGVLWHEPFRTDITGMVKQGVNSIEIEVTNTWVNRMTGDEQFPEDCSWGNVTRAGRSLLEFPAWLIRNEERPVKERRTFATWNYFTKDSPLSESGLMGPVKIVFEGVAWIK